MAPLERLKILMQIQGNQKQYTGVVQVRARGGGAAEWRCDPLLLLLPLLPLLPRVRCHCTWCLRLQPGGLLRPPTRALVPARARVLRSPQGTVQMFRNDGFRGMFKGNGLNCIRIIPNQGAPAASPDERGQGRARSAALPLAAAPARAELARRPRAPTLAPTSHSHRIRTPRSHQVPDLRAAVPQDQPLPDRPGRRRQADAGAAAGGGRGRGHHRHERHLPHGHGAARPLPPCCSFTTHRMCSAGCCRRALLPAAAVASPPMCRAVATSTRRH